MKERIYAIASATFVFIAGCLVGGIGIHSYLRISALENNQAAFSKNVEAFAKQVNDEFAKVRTEIKAETADKVAKSSKRKDRESDSSTQ